MDHKGFRIGGTELRYGLLLAPMAGVTDAAFRTVCRAHGAEYAVTEMISAKALWYHDKKTAHLARITEKEMPCAVQIFAAMPTTSPSCPRVRITRTPAKATCEQLT